MTMPTFEPVAEVCPSKDGTGVIGVNWLNSDRVHTLMYGDKLHPESNVTAAYEALQNYVAEAVEKEREECALICFEGDGYGFSKKYDDIAEAIRARAKGSV